MGVVDLSSGADAGFLFLFFEGGIVFFCKKDVCFFTILSGVSRTEAA